MSEHAMEQIFLDTRSRVLCALQDESPGTAQMTELLRQADYLTNLIRRVRSAPEVESPDPLPSPGEETRSSRKTASDTSDNPKPGQCLEPAPESTGSGTDEEVYMSKKEIREKLAVLSGKGVNISGLMKSMGYDKLSEVPPKQYADLLQKARMEAGENS